MGIESVRMIRGEAARQLRAELEYARAVVDAISQLEKLGLLEPANGRPRPGGSEAGSPQGKEARKKCRSCGKTRPLSEYYEHPHYRDGHKPVCISCERARQGERWKRKLDGDRGQDAGSEARRICTKCGKEKSAEEMCRGKSLCRECNAEYQRQWYARHKKNACEVCGKRFASIDTLTEHRKLRHA